jgi:leucyl-tRNA synthetase
MTESEVTNYNRWSLQEESKIDYGHFSKTGGAGISDDSKLQSFYLTTAINYTNGPAHMGHAYEATTSDAIARYHRLKGEGPVFFLTGADEHGQKIANTAADLGQQPIEICDKVSKQSHGTNHVIHHQCLF